MEGRNHKTVIVKAIIQWDQLIPLSQMFYAFVLTISLFLLPFIFRSLHSK